jgi:molybdate transport repressor ModE-like protein
MATPGEHLPDLDSLSLLLAVEETGSVGAAARRFSISQPAASARLRNLEQQLRVVLLERRTTGSTLTAGGRVVVEWARPLVRAGAEFGRNVDALVGDRDDRLRVAASLTVADYLMPAWLIALHSALPDVSVSLQPGNSEKVTELVLAGDAELGFVEGPHAPNEVRSWTVGHDELVLVVGPSHPWARRSEPIGAAELATGSLVLREPASGTRQVLDLALLAHGLRVRPAMELGSTTAIKHALTGGQNASLLSRLSVTDDLASGTLVSLATPGLDLTRVFRAIWLGAKVPSGAAGALLAISLRASIPSPGAGS